MLAPPSNGSAFAEVAMSGWSEERARELEPLTWRTPGRFAIPPLGIA
jgi:hypothetical protein